jgi:hypothetical protein
MLDHAVLEISFTNVQSGRNSLWVFNRKQSVGVSHVDAAVELLLAQSLLGELRDDVFRPRVTGRPVQPLPAYSHLNRSHWVSPPLASPGRFFR